MTYNNNLRFNLIKFRNNLDDNTIINKSNIMFNYIINHRQYKNNNIIYLYNSYNNELLTDKLIDYSLNNDKIVCLPVCVNNNLKFIKINKNTKYIKNKYHINEPEYSKDLIIDSSGLMIIPIISSYNNYRLGYGKGYYDRYLKNRKYIYTIGVGYDFQNKQFEINTTDIQLDEIKLF